MPGLSILMIIQIKDQLDDKNDRVINIDEFLDENIMKKILLMTTHNRKRKNNKIFHPNTTGIRTKCFKK